ncbi:hypothetical protein RUM44_009341 [Polyplax serrata]|uniref:Bestrophin homolog n=1 Tax=Polyplax serrata TaxID=468196 RepID=A0ABR1ASE8_POLSC
MNEVLEYCYWLYYPLVSFVVGYLNLSCWTGTDLKCIMMDSEKKIFDLMDVENKVMSKYWLPLVWATNIITRARKESLISSDHLVQTILTELSDIRRRLGSLIGYDTVCLPLVYTQIEPIIRKKIAKIEGDYDCDRTEPDAHTLRAPPRSLSSAPSRFGPMFSVLSGWPLPRAVVRPWCDNTRDLIWLPGGIRFRPTSTFCARGGHVLQQELFLLFSPVPCASPTLCSTDLHHGVAQAGGSKLDKNLLAFARLVLKPEAEGGFVEAEFLDFATKALK